jgi:hypothetical protein
VACFELFIIVSHKVFPVAVGEKMFRFALLLSNATWENRETCSLSACTVMAVQCWKVINCMELSPS